MFTTETLLTSLFLCCDDRMLCGGLIFICEGMDDDGGQCVFREMRAVSG